VASALAVLIAAWRFQTDTNVQTLAGLGVGAALAEAFSPRGSDNLIVPAVVWGLAEVMS
jgi:dolichol kinase